MVASRLGPAVYRRLHLHSHPPGSAVARLGLFRACENVVSRPGHLARIHAGPGDGGPPRRSGGGADFGTNGFGRNDGHHGGFASTLHSWLGPENATWPVEQRGVCRGVGLRCPHHFCAWRGSRAPPQVRGARSFAGRIDWLTSASTLALALGRVGAV